LEVAVGEEERVVFGDAEGGDDHVGGFAHGETLSPRSVMLSLAVGADPVGFWAGEGVGDADGLDAEGGAGGMPVAALGASLCVRARPPAGRGLLRGPRPSRGGGALGGGA
jgi:hypothetical protein